MSTAKSALPFSDPLAGTRDGALHRVPGGADDPGSAASIEEVHDLLGDVRRFECEHDPRDLFHEPLRIREDREGEVRGVAANRVRE